MFWELLLSSGLGHLTFPFLMWRQQGSKDAQTSTLCCQLQDEVEFSSCDLMDPSTDSVTGTLDIIIIVLFLFLHTSPTFQTFCNEQASFWHKFSPPHMAVLIHCCSVFFCVCCLLGTHPKAEGSCITVEESSMCHYQPIPPKAGPGES